MLNSSPLTIDLPKHILDRVGNTTLDRDIQLNSLALYTANWYLQCLRFKTHHEDQADCWVHYLSRSAVLEIAGIGKLECVPVTGDAATVTISSDLKDDRVGYLFVKLNESLTSAEIIGFMPKYSETVRLDRLQSTDDLIDYLCDLESETIPDQIGKVLVNLGKWSQGIFNDIWQEIENLPLAPVYRTPAYRNHRSFLTVKSTERGREIMLGDRSDSPSVIITVSYQQIDTDNYNLSLQVYPEESQKALPVGMKFSAIDDLGNGIGSVETTVGDISGEIVLEHGKPGEEFSIEIEFEGVKISESFKI
jgi:Protein of unknown function (DUF1822)